MKVNSLNSLNSLDSLDSFALGLILGGLFMTFISILIVKPYDDKIKETNSIISECEKNVPRSIRCILTAVEEKK